MNRSFKTSPENQESDDSDTLALSVPLMFSSSDDEESDGTRKEFWIDVVREIKAKDFSITKKNLDDIVENFNRNVIKTTDGEIPINPDHVGTGKVLGWCRKLRVVKKKVENFESESFFIQALCYFSKSAIEMIKNREFKYVSAELYLTKNPYRDHETGEKVKNVLLEFALTNRPFVRGMTTLQDSTNLNKKLITNSNKKMEEKIKKFVIELSQKESIIENEFEKAKFSISLLEDEALKKELDPALELCSTKVKKAEEEEDDFEENKTEELSIANTEVERLSQEVFKSNKRISELEMINKRSEQKMREMKLNQELDNLLQEGKITPNEKNEYFELNKDMPMEKVAKHLSILSGRDKKALFLNEEGITSEDEKPLDFSELREQAVKLSKEKNTDPADEFLKLYQNINNN